MASQTGTVAAQPPAFASTAPRFAALGFHPANSRAGECLARACSHSTTSHKASPADLNLTHHTVAATATRRTTRCTRDAWDLEASHPIRRRIEATEAQRRLRAEMAQQAASLGPGWYTYSHKTVGHSSPGSIPMIIEDRLPRLAPEPKHLVERHGPLIYADADVKFHKYTLRLKDAVRGSTFSRDRRRSLHSTKNQAGAQDPGLYIPDISPPFSALKSNVPLSLLDMPKEDRFPIPQSDNPSVGHYETAKLPAMLSTYCKPPVAVIDQTERFVRKTGDRIQLTQRAPSADSPGPATYQSQIFSQPSKQAQPSSSAAPKHERKTILDDIMRQARLKTPAGPGYYALETADEDNVSGWTPLNSTLPRFKTPGISDAALQERLKRR